MHEQLTRPKRVVVGPVALSIRTDVAPEEPRLVALDPRVGFLQVRASVPKSLDLSPLEHEPRLVALQDVERVVSLAVRSDQLLARPGFAHRAVPRLDGLRTRW